MTTIILVDNSNDLNLRIISKRLETVFKNLNTNVSIKISNENIFESTKEKNSDYKYICCSYDNVSESFKKSLERGITASSNQFCLFYYTSGDTDISNLIINEKFVQEEFNKLINEFKRRKEENFITINNENIQNINEISASTECNMAVKNMLNKKIEKQKKESAILNITNNNVISNTKKDENTKDIFPIENNISSDNTILKNNKEDNKLSEFTLENILEIYNNKSIDLKILNENFQSCLDNTIENKQEFLETLSSQQKVRADTFAELKKIKINTDNLIQDMVENRQKYEFNISEEEKENFKVIRDVKQINAIKASTKAIEILNAMNIDQLVNAVEILYEKLPLFEQITEILSEILSQNKDVYDITQKINNPIMPIANYEEVLQKKYIEQGKINKYYQKIQNEGTTVFSLKKGLQKLCQEYKERENIYIEEHISNNNEIPKEYSIPSLNLTTENCIEQKKVDSNLDTAYYDNSSLKEYRTEEKAEEEKNNENSNLQELFKQNLDFSNRNFFSKK